MEPAYIYVFNLSLVLILVLANAFFVVSEFSIVKVRRTKLEELVQQGNARAKIALRIIEHLDSYLSGIQLGITLASLGLGWIGEPAVSRLLASTFGYFFEINPVLLRTISFAIAFGFITVLHVVVGELIPKSLAIQKTETFVLIIAYPLYIFHKILHPLIWIFDRMAMKSLKLMGVRPDSDSDLAHSEEEIRLIVTESQRGGIIDRTESEIIKNAIDFSDIFAHEVMVPRQDIKCLFIGDNLEEVMYLLKQTRHTRYPLCDDDKDNIVGMVHMRDLLVHYAEYMQDPHKIDLRKIARDVLFVPENKPISEILHQMMHRRIHMAIVVDEYGGTAGLLSMEDILEELVGDIMDEHDIITDEPMKRIDENTFEFDGMVVFEDTCEFMQLKECEHDETTIGGYVFGLLGHIPKVGDKVQNDTCEFEVLAANKMRITRVRATVKQDIEDEDED